MMTNTVALQKCYEYNFEEVYKSIISLLELVPPPDFVGKTVLLKQIKERFEAVHHIKPPSSRKDRVEMFIVAMGFRG